MEQWCSRGPVFRFLTRPGKIGRASAGLPEVPLPEKSQIGCLRLLQLLNLSSRKYGKPHSNSFWITTQTKCAPRKSLQNSILEIILMECISIWQSWSILAPFPRSPPRITTKASRIPGLYSAQKHLVFFYAPPIRESDRAYRGFSVFKIHGCASSPESVRVTVRSEVRLPVWKKDLLVALCWGREVYTLGYSGRDFDLYPELISIDCSSKLINWLEFQPKENLVRSAKRSTPKGHCRY